MKTNKDLIVVGKTVWVKPSEYNRSNKEIKEEHVGFMQQGGILDKYDNGRVFVSIVHVVDPKDWQYNEYFTGNGFSKNEDEELRVIEKDSCQLKQKYFEYIEK